MRRLITLLLAAMAFASPAAAQVLVFGPGGPAPAMKEAAKRFEQHTATKVEIVSGPTDQWLERARREADLVYSGSDTMMSGFVRAMPEALRQSEVVPLYDRPAAILVRKGNPKRIRGYRDLTREGLRVMVVEGAGQTGVWEDLASRAGGIDFLRKMRPRITTFAPNSAAAREAWIKDPQIDAWVIWNIWQTANPDIADIVPIEPAIVIYRSMAIVPSRAGKSLNGAQAFAKFLESAEAAAIFRDHGWRAAAAVNRRR